jgi:hypothetical protein
MYSRFTSLFKGFRLIKSGLKPSFPILPNKKNIIPIVAFIKFTGSDTKPYDYEEFKRERFHAILHWHIPAIVKYAAQHDQAFLRKNLCHVFQYDFSIEELTNVIQNIPKEMFDDDNLLCLIAKNHQEDRIKLILSLIPKELITEKVHNECIGTTFTGEEYNKFFDHIPKYKIISENGRNNHNGFNYVPGLNKDVKDFDPNVSCNNGLYFTTVPSNWRGLYECDDTYYGCYIAKVSFRPEARIYIEGNDKCKADEFILSQFTKY